MISAKDHPQESIRVQELLKYEVLDTDDERCFDELTELASIICGTPISLISLVDDHRQWFKSRVGLDAQETEKEIAFCSHAILQEDVFEVPNTLKDERFTDNPLVTEAPSIRFYAGAPLINDQGYPLGTLCVIDNEAKKLSDTQKKALTTLAHQVVSQLELRLHNKRLKRINAEKEKFYAMIAHDLRSPFNGILGLSRVLVTKANSMDPSAISTYSKAILDSSLTIYQLLDEILQWANECIGQKQCRPASHNLVALCQSAKEILTPALDAKDLNLTLEIEPELMVFADDTLLKAVLRNLLSNAIKYSERNNEILIHANQVDNAIKIAVQNTGQAIPDTIKAKLFNESVASEGGTLGEPGNGLGLNLSGEMIARQGGKIWLDDSFSHGARIVFSLPVI
jgi:signal transduction histidine kinase